MRDMRFVWMLVSVVVILWMISLLILTYRTHGMPPLAQQMHKYAKDHNVNRTSSGAGGAQLTPEVEYYLRRFFPSYYVDYVDPPRYRIVDRNGRNGFEYYSIVFGIASDHVVSSVPNKTRDFSDLLPGHRITYKWAGDPKGYYKQYQESRFAVTIKKGGWDCLRHYEIMGMGSIPVFADAEKIPEGTMSLLPLGLLREIATYSGIVRDTHISRWFVDRANVMCTDCNIHDMFKVVDPVLRGRVYDVLAAKILEWTRQHLTCEEIARYMLRVTNNEHAKRVLYIGPMQLFDYMRDNTLVSFKRLFRENLTESTCVQHVRGQGKWAGHQQVLSVSGLLNHLPCITYDNATLTAMIRKRHFDIVVFGSVTRELEYWDEVTRSYPKHRVLLVNGEDCGNWDIELMLGRRYTKHGHYFLREACSGQARPVL